MDLANSSSSGRLYDSTSESQSPNTSLVLRTPRKQDDNKQKHKAYRDNTGGISVFSSHTTPHKPSGLTQFIARNPFDADLTNRLHMSVISPTIFAKVSKISPDSPNFSWTIDELAMMSPVKIDESSIQNAHCSDPEVETHVQKAIDKFFSESQIHPSPWDLKKVPMKPLVLLTPTRSVETLSTSIESLKQTRNCWSQTELSLPPVLPKDVENALKPFFTFNQEQNVDIDDANSSNSSLRRKLFFNYDDSTEHSDEDSLTLSPIKSTPSPAQSMISVDMTPHSRRVHKIARNHGTPNNTYGNVSPPDMSPILNKASSNMSFQSIEFRCQSSRMNFTSCMSIDQSLLNDENSKESQQSETVEDSENNRTTEMVSLLNNTTPLKKSSLRPTNFIGRLNIAANWYDNVDKKLEVPVNRNSTLVGWSKPNGAFQSQDTGYRTHSINDITASQSMTPVKKQFYCDEKITGSVMNRLSDWQENIKIMFSSTPSKYSRPQDN